MNDFLRIQMGLSEKTSVLREQTEKTPWCPWILWRLKMGLRDYLSL